jgi:hypothetical protein
MPEKHQDDDVAEQRQEWQIPQSQLSWRPVFRIKHVCWGGFSILAFLLVMTPLVLENRKKMDRSQAMNQSRSIYLVLMDFESDMGNFPDDETAATASELHAFRGATSNDYLGQLIAGGYVKSEKIFWNTDMKSTGAPADDVISPPSRILEKNECGFSYVMLEVNGTRRGLSTDDHGGMPILVTPLVDPTGVCHPKTYDHHAVYLRVDGAVMSDRLRSSDQKIPLPKGGTLFDQGALTMWGSSKTVVLLPDR